MGDTPKSKWEFERKWWGWYDTYRIGIRWLNDGIYHWRGVEFGPIGLYWEKWEILEAKDE